MMSGMDGMGAMIDVGRWLVEVREDGSYMESRIEADDRAHGGSGPDLFIPGVNTWFDSVHEAALEAMRGLDNEEQP